MLGYYTVSSASQLSDVLTIFDSPSSNKRRASSIDAPSPEKRRLYDRKARHAPLLERFGYVGYRSSTRSISQDWDRCAGDNVSLSIDNLSGGSSRDSSDHTAVSAASHNSEDVESPTAEVKDRPSSPHDAQNSAKIDRATTGVDADGMTVLPRLELSAVTTITAILPASPKLHHPQLGFSVLRTIDSVPEDAHLYDPNVPQEFTWFKGRFWVPALSVPGRS
ncbi:hypothetical protein K461DRAFT_294293 [Myriangium duriaei CBS 260.36]|uniref:Uncharacterized protein n=1 Tax=Myriangium duriaei CBS 260.36 TaxID=1168546 RepID=A0A9P4IZW4_9PEZI|nr:hypothetical protein K461DRAFT_294293 [Myriangium duriaei CBS 260.36]